jgi:energy-coupling factor transport system ATP-binding protein
MIEIEKLKFAYNTYNNEQKAEIRALNRIDAFIYNGEFLAIIGHNGCGKSTLAKHLNALLLPSEGKVSIDGMDTKDEKNLWEIRKSCGMVFQNPDNQIVASIVEEEVAFGPENLGVQPEKILSLIDESLEAVGLKDKRYATTTLLSGGQKQRLAIAGIVAMHPKYIILDEATSMLDPQGRKEVLKVVKKLNKEEGLTVVLITHSMDEAAQADRIIVMEKGKIVMTGTPAEIFEQGEKLKKLRLGVPEIVELANMLRKDGIDVPAEVLTAEELSEFIVEQIVNNSH